MGTIIRRVTVEFVDMRFDSNLKKNYPVGKLDDIFLYFNHYDSFEDAASAWERRKKRLNRNNIIVVSSTAEEDVAMEFINLPIENKLIFVPTEFDIKDDSCFPIDYKNNGNGVTIGIYSNRIANGEISMMDLLSFLSKSDYIRFN